MAKYARMSVLFLKDYMMHFPLKDISFNIKRIDLSSLLMFTKLFLYMRFIWKSKSVLWANAYYNIVVVKLNVFPSFYNK